MAALRANASGYACSVTRTGPPAWDHCWRQFLRWSQGLKAAKVAAKKAEEDAAKAELQQFQSAFGADSDDEDAPSAAAKSNARNAPAPKPAAKAALAAVFDSGKAAAPTVSEVPPPAAPVSPEALSAIQSDR